MHISKKIALSAGAFAMALGISGATATVASAVTPPVSVTSITFSSATSPPTITINGSGLGAKPTGGVRTGKLPNCGNGTYTGNDYPAGAIWMEDASGAVWSAGALQPSKTSGDCVGWKIVSWSTTKAVLQFGNSYGQFNWSLHDGDSLVFSVKAVPVQVTVSGL
jgi:hypothetical protein